MNNKTPLISILIPIYNAGERTRLTLDSIRSEAFSDYEIVIVDDGSVDDSIETVKTVFRDATIICQDNRGITNALNAGIPYCRGEYIYRIDCGDIVLPNAIQAQIAKLQKDPRIGVVGGHIELIDKVGKELGICKYPIGHQNVLTELLNGRSPITHSGALIRKKMLLTINGYDPFFNGREDFDLWCRMSLISHITNLDQPIIKILADDEGISSSSGSLSILIPLALQERKERLRYGLQWKNKRLRDLCQQKIYIIQSHGKNPRMIRRNHAIFYANRGAFLLRSGNRKNARLYFRKALISDWKYLKSWFGLLVAIFIPIYLHNSLIHIFSHLKVRNEF